MKKLLLPTLFSLSLLFSSCNDSVPVRDNYPTTYVDVFYSHQALHPGSAKDIDHDGNIDAIVCDNHVVYYDSTVLVQHEFYQGGYTSNSSIPVGKSTIDLIKKTVCTDNDLKYHLDSLRYEFNKKD